MRARLVTAAAVATATLLSAFLVLGAPPASATKDGDSGSDNKGDIKISTEGGPADNNNEPHVGCRFDIQWYGFERSTSTVSFEPQGNWPGLVITKVAGPDSVDLIVPQQAGSDLNTIQTYELAFTGADPQAQGYHVKVTADTRRPDDKKGDGKTKVIWVDCARSDTTTDPGTTPEPVDGDWQYANPTCDALTVVYPADVPAGQANDANVRFATAQGQFTLNFHNGTGTWSGTQVFDFRTHPQWPAGLTTYHVIRVEVGGTSYDWNGDVSCAPAPVVEPETPFTWDWRYADPTCTALSVGYPANIPDGQANDANLRFESNLGQFTLNYHHNTGTWSGTHVFSYTDHPQWPAGVTSFHVVWTQVGGTNYHWQGDVDCVLEDGTAKAVTDVAGFRTGTLTVGRGSSVASDTVVVDGSGYQDLALQVWDAGAARGTGARQAGAWKTVKAVATSTNGTARVTFPKLTRKGTYKFRLAVAGSGISTGDTTGTLTVRVR